MQCSESGSKLVIKYNFRKPQERQQFCQCGQISMYILSIAHQLMVTRSINNYSESFRWLTTGVWRTLCFFSWYNHFLATRHGKFSSHRSIDTDGIFLMMRCRWYFSTSFYLTQMVCWEGWKQRWEDFFDWCRRWKKRILWRLLDPLQDCGGLDFSGVFASRSWDLIREENWD